MVELADGVGLVPRDAVAEVSVEHGEALLGQHPRVADVHLRTHVDFSTSVHGTCKGLFTLTIGEDSKF